MQVHAHTLSFVLPYEYLDQSSLKPAVGLLCLVYRSLLPCLQVSFVGIDPCPTPVGHMKGNVLGNHGQTSAGCSLDMGQVTVNTPCPMSHVMSPLLHTLGPASPHLEITRQLWRRNHAEEDSCGGVVRKHVMLDAWSVLYPSSHLRASTLLRMPRSNRCHDVMVLHVCLYAIHICIGKHCIVHME